MFRVTATVTQSLSQILRNELKAGERAVTGGIRAVTAGAQADLRGQTATAFGARGRGLANAWRARNFPSAGESLGAAGVVWTQAPTIIDAFERGAEITAKNGGKFLAIPTGFNAPLGRRNSRPRVSPADMVASRQAFLVPFRNGASRGFLWCLKVAAASSLQRTRRGARGSRMVFAANRWQVGTGRGGGRRADGTRRISGRAVQQRLLSQGFVPMFLLLRQVSLAKRLDVAGAARRWGARIGSEITQRWQAPAA